MLKEFTQYVLDLVRPELVETGGNTYSTRSLNRLNVEHDVNSINVRSLSGLVDYVKSNFDHERPVMIHVESPTKVNVFDALNDVNDRRTYVKAGALLPSITFEQFVDREKFQIMLQACFVANPDKEQVLKVVSAIIEENSVQTQDDGVTQRVTAKTGVATVGNVNVPNPVTLKPFRTFAEVSQPESEFVLRLKEGGRVGLFEADGGAWELNAMANIATYLEEALAEEIETKKVYIID
ncbi:hypothetical protein [Psychrobacillus lasiicapitis]|uniref:Phage protein n=1 Tax=Psychrobacillus lasiicapitis TaxID=1636719 RepID=A0A544TA91_9BACI|nr:hypothetical protein [Psychrobacillus lasiicapitis]TQR14373.1 hypothetical protein FG382_07910 [Psychrobacillus lasiicapitis]GGA31910.1 hypothetical protein GCM10011384_21830 [Psychrobacillus lasiicapitis]